MDRFAAFRHRTFRRYFAGQVISSVGSWLQALAVTWLVLDRTGRGDRLGVAIALQFLPLLVLGHRGLSGGALDTCRGAGAVVPSSARPGPVALVP